MKSCLDNRNTRRKTNDSKESWHKCDRIATEMSNASGSHAEYTEMAVHPVHRDRG